MILPEATLRTALQTFLTAYETRDLAALQQVLSQEKGTFHFGTGEDEKIEGYEGMVAQFKRDWAQSEYGKLEIKTFRAQFLGTESAWIAGELLPTVRMQGQERVLPLGRFSAVLHLKNGRWQIVHSHFSWPYADQAAGQSFPAL